MAICEESEGSHGTAYQLHTGRQHGVRRASVEDLSVQEGHETDAGEEEACEDQSLPRRAQGPDGDRSAGRGGERGQAGESRHTRAHGPSPAHAPSRQKAHADAGEQLRGQIPRRIHPVRSGGIVVPFDARRRRGSPSRRCPIDETPWRLSSTTRRANVHHSRHQRRLLHHDDDDDGDQRR